MKQGGTADNRTIFVQYSSLTEHHLLSGRFLFYRLLGRREGTRRTGLFAGKKTAHFTRKETAHDIDEADETMASPWMPPAKALKRRTPEAGIAHVAQQGRIAVPAPCFQISMGVSC